MIPKDLSTIPAADSGGCGILALAIYRAGILKDPSLVFLYGTLYDKEETTRLECNLALLENGEIPYPPCHVVAESDGEWYDHSGKVGERFCDYASHTVTEDELVRCINEIGSWNQSFDRKAQIHVIEKILGVELKDITVTR